MAIVTPLTGGLMAAALVLSADFGIAQVGKRPVPAVSQDVVVKPSSPRVRIGVKLTPFQLKAGTKNAKKPQFVKAQTVRQTLRARIDRENHFFVGDWHIQTKPVTWVKRSRSFTVRMDVYRRYGAFGQLEEKVGSLDVKGVLHRQDSNLYVLKGASRKRFRNKFGHPILDLVAGSGKVEARQGRVATGAPPKASFKQLPKNSTQPYIRGRF